MSLRTRIASITGIVCVAAIVFFLASGLSGRTSPTTPSFPAAGVQSIQESTGLPVRLVIPKIDVDTTVEYVGLLTDGAMGAPQDPAKVGWFNLGPRPGDIGNAVIDGHFGWKNNIPAIFDNIDTLRKGDYLYVVDTTGATTTFVVRELRIYAETAGAEDVFHSTDEKVHLNLITCEGVWNAVSKSYSGRLVIFTDKE